MDDITLPEHEKHSEYRAEGIKKHIDEKFDHEGEDKMSHTPGMNIFNEAAEVGGAGGGFGGGTGGFGSGLVGGVLGGLLFNRRGGLGGDDGGGDRNSIQETVFNTAVLSKLGTIEGAIPLAAANTTNNILEQTIALTNVANQNALATQGGFATTKDAIQNAALLQQSSASQILQAIANSTNTIVAKIDGNTIANLQAELAESRNVGRSREVEVNVSQNVNQQQAQAQAQVQFAALANAVNCLVQNHQDIRQGIVNLGTMVGNTQSAANTKVQ